MINAFNFWSASVTKQNNIVTINGRLYKIPHAINNLSGDLRTSRISKYIFTRQSNTTLSFHEFFALEVTYLFEQVIQYSRVPVNKRVLQSAIDQIKEITWLSNINNEYPSRLDYNVIPKTFTLKPLPYQEEFFHYYDITPPKYNLKGTLLHAAPGTGKTFMSLAIAEMLHKQHVIIICPLPALDRVWYQSINNGIYKNNSPSDIWTSKSPSDYSGQKYIICHYQALPKLQMQLLNKPIQSPMIILDESHNLNEITAKQTKEFISLCRKYPNRDVILASGTPIKALGKEMIPMLYALDPLFTPDVEKRFSKIFGAKATVGLSLLNRRMGLLSHRIEKKEIDIPPPEFITLDIKLPNADRYLLSTVKDKMAKYIESKYKEYMSNERHYQDKFYHILTTYVKPNISPQDYDRYISLVRTIRSYHDSGNLRSISDLVVECNRLEQRIIIPNIPQEYRKEFNHIKSIIKYPLLKIQGEALGNVLAKERMACYNDIATHIPYLEIMSETVKKTVVFSSYVSTCDTVYNKTQSLGLHPLGVYGDTTKDLSSIVKQFMDDKQYDPLVATYKSLSTAVPLIVADTMILVNYPDRDYILQQAISRIHRLGQDSVVKIYSFKLNTGDKLNLTTRNIDIIKWSQDQVEKITGMPSPYSLKTDDIDTIVNEGIDHIFDTKIQPLHNPISDW